MTKIPALLTLILSLAFAISPALTDPFSGFEADQLPIPQIDPPIQPSGYAFSVWGLIYGWLIVSAAFGLIKRSRADDWNRGRWPLMVSLLVGVPWLAIANASAVWATITIIVMAASAIRAMILAPGRDRWLFQAPVGIYAGWLTAASCVSLGTTMAGYGILTDAVSWAFIGITIGLIAATLTFLAGRRAPEYLMTVIWALIGIIVANATSHASISLFAGVGAAILAGLVFRSIRGKPTP